MGLSQSPGDGVGCRLRAVGAAGLAQDVLDVVGYSVEADYQLGGNILVASAIGDEAEHLHLAGSKTVRRRFFAGFGDRSRAGFGPDPKEITYRDQACFPGRFAFNQQVVVAF